MNSDYLSKLRELHESKCKQQVEEEKTACKEATMALLEQTEKPYNIISPKYTNNINLQNSNCFKEYFIKSTSKYDKSEFSA